MDRLTCSSLAGLVRGNISRSDETVPFWEEEDTSRAVAG